MLRNIFFAICLMAPSAYGQTSIKMPNIITPNDDGINDVFRIASEGYTELACTIYNRNGEVVYRFFGLNGSWDGYTHAGILVTPGVYFVYLQVTIPDGSGETRQGTIEVIY